MEPLIPRTLTAPSTCSARTRPDAMLASREPTEPTFVAPLLVCTRHSAVHSPTVIEPLIARASTLVARSTSILPLNVLADTAPKRPLNFNEPDRVPARASAPSGQ